MKCGTPNPNHPGAKDTYADFSSDGTVTCSSCRAINVGNMTTSSFSRESMTSITEFSLLACEFCGMLFDHSSNSAKRSRPTHFSNNESDRRRQFQSVILDISRIRHKDDKQPKTIEAVEKSMDEDDLQRYYSQYISAVREQREPSKSLTEKQLHALVTQLFQSLQYSNHQADGE